MKLFSVGTFIMLFNLAMSHDFSLTITGGGSSICDSSCDLNLVKKQAMTNAIEDGKDKAFRECETQRRGIITDVIFPQESDIQCLQYDIEGGELVSCKAEVTARCDIS
ncbi:MAG: hypothetical protein CME65_00920 [Halobacteriovoraceae bacterium]|nr:hypothetical protein [Halobacteriovoraceae bacterium]|tara:strand:- start:3956 stop:4279 length:324 start_codon:yes stop_codon:yes gene_type:complete